MGYDNCQNCGIGVSLDGTGPEFCAHCAPVSASAGPGASPSPGSRCQTLMGPGCFGNLCGPCDSDYAALLDRLAAAERRAEEAEENPGRVWHEWRKRVERVFTVFAHEVMPIAEADDHRKDPEVVLPYLEAWFERLNEAENALASERAARESWEREFHVANAERIRLHNEAENFSERLGQFEAAGFPNVATVLDRVETERAARERAEARLRETEVWHKAAVRERDLMREQMDEILRYEDIETPGPDENVASVVLAALEHLREARERAERERDEAREEIARHPRRCTVDNKCEPCRSEERAWEQADAAEARAEKAESSLSRAVEALLALKKEASWLGASHPHLAHYYYINGATWDQIKAVLAEVGK